MVWPLALKNPGLWDRGMAFDVRMRTEIEKIPRSDRQWCGHWGYKNPVCQTEMWPTEWRNSVWPLVGNILSLDIYRYIYFCYRYISIFITDIPITSRFTLFKIFYHCRCTSVVERNQDCVISIVCTTYVFIVNFAKFRIKFSVISL